MGSRYEKELAILKLQNALLRLPKEDLTKLLKNTYQAMRIKHGIPYETKLVPKDCLANKKSRPIKKKATPKKGKSASHEPCACIANHNEPLHAAEAALNEYTNSTSADLHAASKHTTTTNRGNAPPNAESDSHTSVEEIEYPTFRQVQVQVPEPRSTSVHAIPEFSPIPDFEFNKASLHPRPCDMPQANYSHYRPLQPHFYCAPGQSRFRGVVPPGVATPFPVYNRVPMR